MQLKRNILLNPGPATTTDTVKLSQVVPDICPREKDFKALMQELALDLLKVVHADPDKYSTVLFCGSGTICMDACLSSLLPDKKKILVICNGAYSERAISICEYYNLPHLVLKFPIDELPCLQAIEEALQANKDITVVYTTHNETGTGLLNPIKEIGAIAQKYNATFIVDTISTYGMLPINIEEENIDFCMASAQKGLSAMTGLSFVIGSKKLIEASAIYPKRSYYCSLFRQYNSFQTTGEMHFTPPVQTIYAAKQALVEYFSEGECNKWNRHKTAFETINDELKKLGFRSFIKPEIQAGLIVSVIYPDDLNWNFNAIHDYCYEKGFTIYPGKVANTNTFRLCVLGSIDKDDILMFFRVFKEALKENNIIVPVKYNKFGD